MMKRRVLQLCCRDYARVKALLPKAKEMGFTTVQLSPIQTCKEMWDDNGRIKKDSDEWLRQSFKEFWKTYQPMSETVGNHLFSWDEFTSICEEAHTVGLEIVVDVVLRHLSQDDYGRPIPHPNCDQGIASRPEFFMNDKRKADNFGDREGMVRGELGGLPTLNYENQELQEKVYFPFLDALLQHCDGIRGDMFHHFGLPSEGYTFFTNVIKPLKEKYPEKYITGECNNANDKQLEEYSQYFTPIVYVGQWWGHKEAQFYFENHDTTLSFGFNLWMGGDQRLNEYESVLRRGGDALFFARMDDENNILLNPRLKALHEQYR